MTLMIIYSDWMSIAFSGLCIACITLLFYFASWGVSKYFEV